MKPPSHTDTDPYTLDEVRGEDDVTGFWGCLIGVALVALFWIMLFGFFLPQVVYILLNHLRGG